MRRIALCMLLLLGLLLVPAAAFAQTDECSGPIDPESDLIAGSQEAMAALESYASSVGFDIALTNAPNLPAELSANMLVDGEFALDPSIMTDLHDFGEMDPEEIGDNMDELMGLVAELYQNIDFNMDMGIGVSVDLANLIAANSGMPLGAIPTSLAVPMRMTDGFLYFNIDDIAAAFDAPEGVAGWFGIDYGTLMSDAIDQALEQMESGDAMSTDSMSGMMASVGGTLALQQAIKEYVSIEGMGTSEVDGVEVCELQYTYDLGGFLSDPAFISMMVDQLKTQAAMQAEMGASSEGSLSDSDIEMIESMAPMLAPMLLSGLEAEMTTLVGVEDLLVYASETNVSWDLGSLMSMAAAMMSPGSEPEAMADAPYFEMNVSTTNSAFDEPFEVEVPDPVEIIPLESLQAEM